MNTASQSVVTSQGLIDVMADTIPPPAFDSGVFAVPRLPMPSWSTFADGEDDTTEGAIQ